MICSSFWYCFLVVSSLITAGGSSAASSARASSSSLLVKYMVPKMHKKRREMADLRYVIWCCRGRLAVVTRGMPARGVFKSFPWCPAGSQDRVVREEGLHGYYPRRACDASVSWHPHCRRHQTLDLDGKGFSFFHLFYVSVVFAASLIFFILLFCIVEKILNIE